MILLLNIIKYYYSYFSLSHTVQKYNNNVNKKILNIGNVKRND